MLTPEVIEHIEALVAEINPDAYVVDVRMVVTSRNVLRLKVDTDAGILLDECSKLNRELGLRLDALDLIPEEYGMEVSSPGVGTPLKLRRQYVKEVGRTLSVLRTDGTQFLGKLTTVNEDTIVVEPTPEGKRKKSDPVPEPIELSFNDIKEAKVVVVF